MPETKGLIGRFFKPLSQKDIERIHAATLRICDEVGFQCLNKKALETFAQRGARVNFEERRVWFPPQLVEKCIASAPSRIVLCGRDPKNDVILEGERVYLGTGGAAPNVIDLETGERRPATLQDLRDIAKLVDALDNIHFFHIPVFPQELTREQADVSRFYASVTNITKHVSGSLWSPEGVRNTIRMAAAIVGGYEELKRRPIYSAPACLISPLRLDDEFTECMIVAAENGIPLIPSVEALAGNTAPATLAGCVLQTNAEALLGVMLSQCVNPGTPVLYATVSTIADPRRMSYTSGAVEMGLIQAAGAQMAQFYRIPIYATSGMSDSKLPDIQAGYEKAVTTTLVALSGANWIHDSAGFLEFCLSACFEEYVIDDEINGMVMRALRGIEVNDDTLAFEVIKELGPAGGYYEHKHTARHLRTEYFYPRVADRCDRTEWVAKGSKDARERAREIAKEILRTHKPLPIPPEIDKKIRETTPNLVM